jgi:ribose transport system permease protein
MKKELGLFILLVVLCLSVVGVQLGEQLREGVPIGQLKLPSFLSAFNLANTANVIGIYGIFSIGLGIVIITGGIDLSVGSMFALTGVLLAMMLREWHWPWPLATAAVIALPMLLGWGHGMVITRQKIQPFIVTLCGLLIYRGLARYITGDDTKGFGDATGFEPLKQFCTGKVFGLPMTFIILLVIAAIMWVVLNRSVFGRHLLAVGRNEEAARFSGINSRNVITCAYVLAGVLTGIAGILLGFYTVSIGPSTHGNFFELYGIAAAVLGGCSLRGGEGSIIGVVIGTALLRLLENLVNLLGIPSSLNFAVMGAVVLIGVLADQYFQRRAEKKLAKIR